jgi:ankyrin repeat protein
MIAAQYGSLQAVKLLTDCAFISKNNSKDQMGSTVLHYAALNRDPDNEVYRFLLRTLPQGAEAIKNNQHLTPADILRCEINRRAGIPCNN